MGPARSGKSALVNIIANRVHRSAQISGSLVFNGKSLQETGVRPTFFCASDEPLANVTVEQALVYTGEAVPCQPTAAPVVREGLQ